MKICIIAEGCYPYVAGGVSVWLQNLMTAFSQHEFLIVAIGAETAQKNEHKFKTPENVKIVTEVFLDSILTTRGRWGKKISLSAGEEEMVRSLVSGGEFNAGTLFGMIGRGRIKNTVSFILSRKFYDIVADVCEKEYPDAPFSDFYWNARSMALPLFFLMNKKFLPEADLYHSVSAGYAGILGAVAGFYYKKPFMLTEHGIYTREREEEIIISKWVPPAFKDLWIRYFYSMSKIAYNAADKVISLFERNRKIQVFIGCKDEKTKVIPNGVDTAKFADVPPAVSAVPTIGAVVRLVPIKDIKTLIQAFQIVKKRIPDSRLYVLGPTDENPEYYKECVDLVKDLDLADVVFMGRGDVADVLKDVHVVTLTSISEGQPLALLEAMAAGRPCVATNVGCCSELLDDVDGLGAAGIVTPIMQPEKTAQALIEILSLPDKGAKLGKSGQARVRAYYNNRKWLEEYHQLYENAAGQQGG